MKRTIIHIIIIFIGFSTFAQENTKLPMGFRELTFGKTLDEIKILISEDGYFDYQGDPDVSMLLTENRILLEADGRFYIKKGYFQFNNDFLYSITLILDPNKMDFHTIYSSLKEKYGQHNNLSPKIITWEDDYVILQLEKPLTVKYIDKQVFDGFIEEDKTKEAIEETLRREFINEL